MWLWIEMKGWKKLILWEWTLWASSLKATKETEKSCASLRYFVSGPVIRRQLPSWQKQLFLDGRHWRHIANYPLYTVLFPSSDLPHFYPSSSLYPCTPTHVFPLYPPRLKKHLLLLTDKPALSLSCPPKAEFLCQAVLPWNPQSLPGLKMEFW